MGRWAGRFCPMGKQRPSPRRTFTAGLKSVKGHRHDVSLPSFDPFSPRVTAQDGLHRRRLPIAFRGWAYLMEKTDGHRHRKMV